MQIQITGHHVEITEALRELTEKKLKKLVQHLDSITSIHVTFNIDNLTQIAKAQVNFPGNSVHASAESKDMYKTVDLLVSKLKHQIDKHKEKLSDYH